ncbi:MAG: hypothetical protein M3O30_00045 [Planctomycetota bacterium]|nr:hypothetical protein [Planctomycetota bacterium]
MVSQRRIAQMGLVAATLVLIGSFGLLAMQGSDSTAPNPSALTLGATQAPSSSVLLAAPPAKH